MTNEAFRQLVAGHLPKIEHPCFDYQVTVAVNPESADADLAKIREWVELEPVDAPPHDWSVNPWIIVPARQHYRFTCCSQAVVNHRIALLPEPVEIESIRRQMRKAFHPYVYDAVRGQSHRRANIDVQLILRDIVADMSMAPRVFDRDGLTVEIRPVERDAELHRFDWDAWASVPVRYDQNVMVISQAGQPLCSYWYAKDEYGLIHQMCSKHTDEDEDRWIEYLIMDFEAVDQSQLAPILRGWVSPAVAEPEPTLPTPAPTWDFNLWEGLRDLAASVKLADLNTLSFEDVTLTLRPMPVPCTFRGPMGAEVSHDRVRLELHRNGAFLARFKFVWDAQWGEIFSHPHFETERYRIEDCVDHHALMEAIERCTTHLTSQLPAPVRSNPG
jgi:hypothetical protein